MCSSDNVTSVVATDRTTVVATIAMTAHSGKCAAAAAGGGGGGGGTPGAPGGTWVADAAGANPIATVRRTASPLKAVSVRRVRGTPRAGRRAGCARSLLSLRAEGPHRDRLGARQRGRSPEARERVHDGGHGMLTTTTLIIPALNEAGAIGDLVRRVPAGIVREVVVVDNGSTDATATVAAAAGAGPRTRLPLRRRPRLPPGRRSSCATYRRSARTPAGPTRWARSPCPRSRMRAPSGPRGRSPWTLP